MQKNSQYGAEVSIDPNRPSGIIFVINIAWIKNVGYEYELKRQMQSNILTAIENAAVIPKVFYKMTDNLNKLLSKHLL